MKKFLLSVAFTSAFAAGLIAQTSNSWSQGTSLGGKRYASHYAMRERGARVMAQTYERSGHSDQSILPRDLPFGKGNADNDTFNLPNETDLSHGRW